MTKFVDGGWMSYTQQVNNLLERKMTQEEYKFAMTQYLMNKPPESVKEKINGCI